MLLARARAAGLALRVEGGQLAVKGPKPSDDLLAALRARRDDLIRALKIEAGEVSPARTPDDTNDDRAVLEENARIALTHAAVRQDADGIARVHAWFRQFNETA